jgi:N-acetylmuramoyl-L-alanine amidase
LTLKDALRARGVEVYLTRDDNTDVAPVGSRATAAKAVGCTSFLSLHLNDVESDQANGTETLFRGKMDLNLAAEIQEVAVAVLGTKDRGLKERTDLAVLKFDGPAALLELGFIGNDGDRNRLLSTQVRHDLCEALAEKLSATSQLPNQEIAASDIAADIDSDENDALADDRIPYDTQSPVFAATAAASPHAFARAFDSSVPTGDFDWVAFTSQVQSWGLKHFGPMELLTLGGQHSGNGPCGGKNSFPPHVLWHRMEETAKFADAIRDALGHPVLVLSAYRNADYNKCVGGEKLSLHRDFNALDLRPSGGSLRRMLDIARALRGSNKRFEGGIGFYPGSNFIHIDTRGVVKNW